MGHDAMTACDETLHRGVYNLLSECAEARPGETLVILFEDPMLGHYGPGLAPAIAAAAADYGLSVRTIEVPFVPEASALPEEIGAELTGDCHVLFVARLGDQLRFQSMPRGVRPIVSYALDMPMLASPFGVASYTAFIELKSAFNRLFGAADEIRVTCGRGTDYRGRVVPVDADETPDVSIKRFPLSIFAPLDASGFRGRVAVAHFLAGTGSRYYTPFALPLRDTIFAEIGGGRLVDWQGPSDVVASARAHYDHVADLFGIDRDAVHSWHAGMHPGCAYGQAAADNVERWSGGAFGNPRLLHFHTCGAYAPGEICWNVVDPTIAVDGRIIWERGRIMTDRVPEVRDILSRYPDVARLFETPSREIGLAP